MTQSNADETSLPIVFIDDAHTFGGAQIAMAWAIRVLLRNTAERIVCVSTAKTSQVVREIAGNDPRLEFIECPKALPLNVFSFPLRLWPFLSIVRRLRRSGVRAWWLNLSGIEFCLAPQVVLKSLGEKPRAWLHNTERFAFFNTRASWSRRALSRLRDRIADRWLFGIHSWIITPSKSTEIEMLARIRGTRRPSTGYLYYPTIGEQHPQTHPEGAVEDPGDGAIHLWMIGRVEYGHKNNLAALDAMQVLKRAGTDATLMVVGDGPDMADFKSSAEASGLADKISFLGWQTDPWRTVPQNSLVFIPSFYESMSLVAREAMIRGLRLVASPIPVFREWIPAPLLSDDFSAQAFADRILDVQHMNEQALLALYATALARFSDSIFKESFLAYTDAQ
jgi:glycosyltransferase involved in cell wall biosynthesis